MKCLVLVLYVLIWGLGGAKRLHRGRRTGGNLIPPTTEDRMIVFQDQYFEQVLDHSDPTNRATWKQRYYLNDNFFNKSKRNVAFLMVGGEAKISSKWMYQGAWIKSAKEHGAICFQLEHRFYGTSQPFQDLSTEHLKLLTSQQALDDLATFIVAMNKRYELLDVKWITFGGSYSGSLAAWLRMKYSHLVHGAVSSSAPLYAKVDFEEYFLVVAKDLSTVYSEECASVVKTALSLLEEKVLEGNDTLGETFNLCDTKVNTNVGNDVSNLFSLMTDSFAYAAQYNNDNRNGEFNINYVCDIMTNSSFGNVLDRLAYLNADADCIDYSFESMIRELRNETLDSGVSEGARQWTYQTCTEFAFYQTTNGLPQIFTNRIPLQFYIDICSETFGAEINHTYLNRITERTNVIYGAYDIQVSNVVFVHGTLDPWYPLGLIGSNEEGMTTVLINGTAHCANMYDEKEDDSKDLKEARDVVQKLIRTWINEL